MTHNVFISYSTHGKDKAVADAICKKLEDMQIGCWIAPRDVLPGMEWAEAIVDAIDKSKILILVLSVDSNDSPQVIREVGRAVSKGIPIISFRVDNTVVSKAMDYFISSHQWLDAQKPPIKKHLQKLANTTKKFLTQQSQKDKKEEAGTYALPEESLEVEKPIIKSYFFWTGSIFIFLGLIFESWTSYLFIGSPKIFPFNYFGIVLFFTLFLPGIFALRTSINKSLIPRKTKENITNRWWTLPILFGVFGGVVCWNKHNSKDWHKALNMLTVGILVTFFWFLPIYGNPFYNESPYNSKLLSVKPSTIYVGESLKIKYFFKDQDKEPNFSFYIYLGKPKRAIKIANISLITKRKNITKTLSYKVTNKLIGKQKLFLTAQWPSNSPLGYNSETIDSKTITIKPVKKK